MDTVGIDHEDIARGYGRALRIAKNSSFAGDEKQQFNISVPMRKTVRFDCFFANRIAMKDKRQFFIEHCVRFVKSEIHLYHPKTAK